MSEHASDGWWDARTFGILLVAGLVGVVAVLPYQFALTGWPTAASIPLPLALTLIQNGLLIGLAVLVGLRLGTPVGLAVYRPGAIPGRSVVAKYGRGAVTGVAAGALILLLDAVVFGPLIRGAVLGGAALPAQPARGQAAWVGLVASLYGGITEELFLRFGLMSLLAWLGWRLMGRPDDLPPVVAWAGILIAALLFAVGHLGATAAVSELTPAVLVRMLVLNGIGGLIFGWLYWRYDLVSAMAAHFSADIVLHVLAVSLG